MNKLLYAAVSAAALALGGCATVMNGTNQPVDFRSDPAGAEVVLLNGQKCVTPCQYEMRRGDDSRVTITKDGYEPVTIFIHSRMGGSTFGNILAGGIIGGVVDGSNGASNHLYPNPVSVRLVRRGSTDKAVLLDKKGEVISTVEEYNASVVEDVTKGLQKQGHLPAGQTAN